MYSLGSWSDVGSWFFISVTSKVRKSLAEIVDESSLDPVDPVDPAVVPLVPAAVPAAVDAPAGLVKAALVPLNAAPAAMW
jgi:hypothetical protein